MPTARDTVLAASLTDALHTDPFYRAITAALAPGVRHSTLQQYFQVALQEGRRSGVVCATRDGWSGAAVWAVPQEPATLQQRVQAKQLVLRALLGPAGWAAYTTMVTFLDQVAHAVIPPSAWYLSILGVAPTAQGHGLGTQLLQPTLAHLDTQGLPAYLETFNPRSVPFYARHTFQPIVEALEPSTQHPYWVLLRHPQPTP